VVCPQHPVVDEPDRPGFARSVFIRNHAFLMKQGAEGLAPTRSAFTSSKAGKYRLDES